MKKLASVLLIAVMLFSLAACSEPAVKTEEEKEEDITRLSAEELYGLGCEKNRGLMSAEYDTEITSAEGESVFIKTVRIREGYDSFRYSRTSSAEEVYFYEGTAYQKNADGAFSAPASSRVFQDYAEEYLLPLGAFGAEALFEVEKKDLVLTYHIKNETVLSRFAALCDSFQPTTLTGTCTLSEDGVMIQEEFCVTGTVGTEEKAFIVKTTLSRYRSSEIEIQKPQNTENFVGLGDIRLPGMIKAAADALQKKETVQATFVSGNTLLAGGKNYGFHREMTAYQTVAEDKTPLGYLTRQSLKKLPDGAYESRFYQKHIASGIQKENSYDVVTATLLSENESTAISLPWPTELWNFLPRLSDLKTIEMTEDSVGYSVRFTLTEKAKTAFVNEALTLFPEAGIALSGGMTFTEPEGTFLISRDLCLTAASFSVEASFASANGEQLSFEGQCSMNVDALENISVPSMQVPTPTTPDMAPEGAID